MPVLIWIATGVIAGLLAQFVLADKWRGGLTGNLVVGAIGAVVAGSLLRMHGIGASGVSLWSFAIALTGAAVLLWAGRGVTAQEIPTEYRGEGLG